MTSPNAVVSRRYRIEGMECAGCAAGIQSALTKRPEVSAASVDFLSGMATVEGSLEPEAVCELVRRRGFGAEEIETAAVAASAASGGDERSDARADIEADDFAFADADEELARVDATLRKRASAWKRRAFIGIGLWLPMELLHWLGHKLFHHAAGALAIEILLLAGATLALIFAGSGFFASAWRAGRHGRASMDTLVAMGVTSAYLLSLGTFIAQRFDLLVGAPLWFAEATALLGIIALGHWLEARATARASSATRELLALQPERCERFAADGTIEMVPSRGVRRGDRLLVRPGGRVPVDGRIVEGRAAIDEQALTGEPLPVARGVGETLRAGSIAIDGALTLEATVHGDRTTLLRIAALVQRAQSSKAPVQRLADRIAAVFVPAVLLVAAATLVGWSLAGLWLEGVLAATTVLVISCPCALGIATPMAIMVGTGAASRRGMLIKDAATLERAASVAHVVFDKTGTLTLGQPTVTSVEAVTPFEASEVLRLAAAVEIHSEHPIGKAIVRAASGPQPTATQGVHGFEALPGLGVRARVDGAMVEVLRDAVASCRVVRDGTLIGRITVSDTPRAGAAEAIAMLRATEGTRSIHMLTGDRAEGARAIGAAIGLRASEIIADATPTSKVASVRHLRESSSEGSATVLLVGDGINDAAALAEADVGIAMGGGTAIAIEAAPIVLLSEDPRAVPALLRVAKATMRCVRQNLVLAFAYNTIAIPAAAFGLLGPRGPLIAAAAMALSNLSVVGNALRLRRRLARLEVR